MATEIDDGVLQKNGVGGSNITDSYDVLEPKYKVFLSHSGAQKDFVEQLCVDLETVDRYPFIDKRRSSLPIGEMFPKLIFDAIQQCEVGVLILSEKFFTKTKWPMIELVAMVKELEKSNSNIKIIPVFYHISRQEYLDVSNHNRWMSHWEEWANEDKRISVEEWKRALEVLKPINSLVTNGTGDVNALKQIVSAVCELVLPESKWDDFHVEGRLRLCEVLRQKINQERNGVRIIGLYGMGGIGKTTICKAICNKLFHEFHGRVCHAELQNGSGVEVLREVLKKFTNTQHEYLNGLEIDQCRNQLKKCIVEEAVFLAVDNVSDNLEAIRQAKTYLGARWAKGSVIIVTARSLDNLLLLHQYIDEHNCIEMPELEKDEARSLFLQHITCGQDDTVQMDEELVRGCVERCYFFKGVDKGHHFIPLALKVLGEQLGCNGYDAEQWKAQLRKIDTFDLEFSGNEHPIFSILRSSFDSLSHKAQMLFIDFALFMPPLQFFAPINLWPMYNFCDWLSMVHGLHIDETKRQLEGLKRKSLLENSHSRYVMHDLWFEFCVAETKVGRFGERRWVFLEEASGELGEISPPGCCWEHLKRIYFLNQGWRSLHGVHLKDFMNVTVLKLRITPFIQGTTLELDLKGLKHLRSLEVTASKFKIKCVGLGSSTNLVFLSWESFLEASSPCCEEIGHLTKLQVLKRICSNCEISPDVNMMTSLRVAALSHDGKVVTGLSSKLSSLQFLSLEGCTKLQECPGLGELYGLEVLILKNCRKLKEVPSLRLLTRLRILNIGICEELRAVPGLSELVALETLETFYCYKLGSLPDMRKLTKLKRLGCSDLSEMDVLDLGQFPRLTRIHIRWSRNLKSVTCNKPLYALKIIRLAHCSSLEELPDLSNFPQLKVLDLTGCAALMSLTSSVSLHALEILDLQGCSNLSALPDHLSSSVGLRELCLHDSAIVLRGEDIRELEASFKSLKVFPSIGEFRDHNEYSNSTNVTCSDRGKDELGDLEINVHIGCRSRRLPDTLPPCKVSRLIYSIDGDSLIALTSNGMHKRWVWGKKLSFWQATASVAPQLWRPPGGMINVTTATFNPEVVPCMALSTVHSTVVISASGGIVSVFRLMSTKVLNEPIQTPSAPTALAFHPHTKDIIVIGMEDSTIQIYHNFWKEVVCTLEGHQKRITGLTFSEYFNVLVSLGADAQLCVWEVEEWSKRQAKSAPLQPDQRTPCVGDVRVQFRSDQRGLLVVGKLQLAVYDVLNLDHPFVQWVPQSPFAAAITDATYSCDGQLVYASFSDGSIAVLSAHRLQPTYRFAPPIHTFRGVSGSTAYPLTIAAHPMKRGQFALGMSDGSVIVVEPWAPADNESGSGEPIGYATVVQEGLRTGESEEELKIPDADLARRGCLDYCSCVFFTSALNVCCGYFANITGASTSKDESDNIEINMQNHCRSRRLPDTMPLNEVKKLIYSNAGDSLVALTSDSMHKRWDWENEATVSFAPHLWSLEHGTLVINDINDTYPVEAVPCMAVCRDNCHLISASGEVSVFHLLGTQVINTSIQTPSAATSVAFHPHQEHIIVIGMEDSTVQIYNNCLKVVVCTLEGHQKRITGLTFSEYFNVLVSLGADAQLCVWKVEEWSKRQAKSAPLQPDRRTPCVGDVRVQFRSDRRGLLVVGKSQLAVYDLLNLDRPLYQLSSSLQQSRDVPQKPFTAAISDATFSCDGEYVFASFVDGSVGVMSFQNLRPHHLLAPPVHTPWQVSGSTAYPMVIAAHPKKPGQFALGMSDGSVIVVEPWGTQADNESGGETTRSGAVPQDDVRTDERAEEPRRPDAQLARCGCLDLFFSFFPTR